MGAQATHADGILTLDVPKRLPAPARTISIVTSGSSSNSPRHEVAAEGPVDPALALAAMGFTDDELVQAALDKHNGDVEAAGAALAALDGEWTDALDDMEEMGFGDRHTNSK